MVYACCDNFIAPSFSLFVVAHLNFTVLDIYTALPYIMCMQSLTFIELPPFTRHIYRYMSEEEYQGLQDFLGTYPNAGDVIPGTRGCRKLRWRIDQRGKRGGVRVIYYYQARNGRIFLLTLYAKNEEANLPSHFVCRLREEIKDE